MQYPGAIKVFAREVCRNDILNFGRMHFFFPDSRLALDLNTDKTLKVGDAVGVRPVQGWCALCYLEGWWLGRPDLNTDKTLKMGGSALVQRVHLDSHSFCRGGLGLNTGKALQVPAPPTPAWGRHDSTANVWAILTLTSLPLPLPPCPYLPAGGALRPPLCARPHLVPPPAGGAG